MHYFSFSSLNLYQYRWTGWNCDHMSFSDNTPKSESPFVSLSLSHINLKPESMRKMLPYCGVFCTNKEESAEKEGRG